MNNNEEFIVQSETPDRLYVKVYHDFLDSTLLDRNEKMVFILLKRYLNFKHDLNGVEGQVFPTLETLGSQCGMSKGAVIRTLKSLQKKEVLKIEQRGLNKPNLYTIRDFSGIWKSDTQEKMVEEIRQYEITKAIELLKQEGIIKEKELISGTYHSTDINPQNYQIDISDNTTAALKSQYTFDRKLLDRLYEFEIIQHDYQEQVGTINNFINIIQKTLNSSKEKIKIKDEVINMDKVKSRFLNELNYYHLLYVAEEIVKREIKSNLEGYIISSLYNSVDTIDTYYANRVYRDAEKKE